MQSPRHENNFDFLRVAAAGVVLVSHQFALAGHPEPMVLASSWGGLGVLVFFAISGYLVAGSWQQDPRLGHFLARRLLRIWPGLAVACLLVACALGPTFSTLGVREYFASPQSWDYLKQLGLWQYKAQLPGVFAGNPVPGSANGSLWTIPVEIRCYLALAVVGVLGLLRRDRVLLLSFAAACAWFFFLYETGYEDPMRMKVQMGIVFFAGVALHALLPLWRTRKLAAATVGLMAVLGLWHSGLQELAFTLGLPLAVVLFGAARWPVLRRFGRFGDVSYGLYIYAYPVQQAVIAATDNRLTVLQAGAISGLLTLVLAALSWHLVEKRALRLKDRLRPQPAAAEPAPNTLASSNGVVTSN